VLPEVDNCECSSCANLSRCVMNLVVLAETYVSERSCCAEVNNSGCSSCANLSTCVLNLVVASETYA
jgi:hypothetical protein